jgi:hypothetical protein
MGPLVRRTIRSLAIGLGFVLAFVFVAGARPVYAYVELRCPSGYTAQPVSIAPVYECRPENPDPTAIQWPQTVAGRHEIGLYLVNLRMRVFHFDFVWGTSYGLAFGVPSPP